MSIQEPNGIEDFQPPFWPEDFGERLEHLLKLGDLSWQELAELLGVTERTVMKWSRGRKPSSSNFWAIMELSQDVPTGFKLMLYGEELSSDVEEG